MPSCEVRRFYGMFAASQFMVDSSIWSFFFTQTHNISLATAVAIHATTTIAAGAFDLPTGSWADRFGRRRIVLLGFVSRAIAAIMMVVAPSLPMFFLAAVLAGFGWAQLSGAAEALLHDNLKALGAESTFKHHMANVVITSYMSRTAALGSRACSSQRHPGLPTLYRHLHYAWVHSSHRQFTKCPTSAPTQLLTYNTSQLVLLCTGVTLRSDNSHL